jgi:glycerol kinase
MHGVPIACLPQIVAVDGDFGAISGVPLRASIVDQQAALFGHGCRAPGDAKITFGTGAFLLALAGDERPPPGDLLPTIAWHRSGAAPSYAIEGGVYDAGSAIEWARKLGLFTDMAELATFAGPSALSRGIVFVPALVGLAAPYHDRQAAALFIGMDHATDRHDLVRAILEGIAMLTVGLIEAAAAMVPLGPHISIDGGLAQSPYFAQFLASASQRRIIVPAMHELTALGLAELCGVNVGPARAPAQSFVNDGTVPPTDHARFTAAIHRTRAWRTIA